ncbi:MAG: hypothetical protein ACKOCN_07460, partial [Planctomycetaceae bacterium]
EAKDDALIERLRSEGANTPADVLVLVDAARLDRATDLGLLRPTSSAALTRDVPANLRDARGRWYGLTRRVRVAGVTPALGQRSSVRCDADLAKRGREGSLAEVFFGRPARPSAPARRAASAWRPRPIAAADCTVFSLHHDPSETAGSTTPETLRQPSLADLARGIAAAARITAPDGTICGCCRVSESPGPVVARWREGVPLEKLVREAFRSGDDSLVEDAGLAISLSSALGSRRLVLLSDIDPDSVEILGFGHAESPDAVSRLARSARSLAVLHEADRMIPERPPGV